MDTTSQIIASLLALGIALAFIGARLRAFEFSGSLSASGLGSGFYLFAIALGLSLALGIASGIIRLKRRPDVAERQRASGFVAVGVIGTASRLEYTAVGAAAHGEVLVDERTAELAGTAPPGAKLFLSASRTLKGYSQPVRNFLLAPD